LPWAAVAAERRGERSEVAERIRERHRKRFDERRGMRQQGADAARAKESAAAPPDGVARLERMPGKPGQGSEAAAPLDMDARRQQAVRDWLQYRADLEERNSAHGRESAQPLSMDEIRQRAVAAWRSLQARGAESTPSADSRPQRQAGGDRRGLEQASETPGLDGELSG
jgi:hypothetical protein